MPAIKNPIAAAKPQDQPLTIASTSAARAARLATASPTLAKYHAALHRIGQSIQKTREINERAAKRLA